MKENPIKLKQAIDEMADKCLLAVEQLRANAHAQVDQKVTTILKKSDKQKQTITGQLNTLKSCIRFVQKTLSCRKPAARTAMVAKAASVLIGVTLAPTKVSATVPLVMAVKDIESMLLSERLVSEFNSSKIKVTGWTHSTLRNQMVSNYLPALHYLVPTIWAESNQPCSWLDSAQLALHMHRIRISRKD